MILCRLLCIAFHYFLADINLPDLPNLLLSFTDPLDLLDYMDYGSPGLSGRLVHAYLTAASLELKYPNSGSKPFLILQLF